MVDILSSNVLIRNFTINVREIEPNVDCERNEGPRWLEFWKIRPFEFFRSFLDFAKPYEENTASWNDDDVDCVLHRR